MAKIFKAPNARQSGKKHSGPRKHQSAAKQLPDFSGEVIGYDHQAQAIIKTQEGKVTFVEGGIVGETIKVRPKTYTKGYIHAELLEVQQASPQRIQPACPHFDECGGCQLQHLDKDQQLKIKQQGIEQLFHKSFKNLNTKNKPLAPLPWADNIDSSEWQYRRTARLATWYDKQSKALTIGFRQNQNKHIINISHCPILVPVLNQIVESIHPIIAHLSNPESVSHIQLIAPNSQAVVILRVLKKLTESDRLALTNYAKKLSFTLFLEPERQSYICLHNSLNDNGTNIDAFPKKAEDSSKDPILLEYNFEQIFYQFSPSDFIQINDEVNQKMVKQAIDWLQAQKSDRLLDLYCGIGNFTLPFAQRVSQVIAVEGVNDMVKRVRHNAALNQLENVTAYQADLSTISERKKPQWLKPINKLILDPARDGAFELVKKIPLLNPEKILYISCNPATLARDLNEILQNGYKLSKLSIINMFPQTSHAEVMVLLEQQ